MKNILFLHDTNLSLLRGAELTIMQLINLGKKKGYVVSSDLLRDFEQTKQNILGSDLIVLNSTSRCRFELELLHFLLEIKIRFIKVEYDYNFCVRRNILCTVDRNVRLCCNTDKFHIYRQIFANAVINIFQSPKHYQNHEHFYGEAVKNHMLMPPTVEVENIRESKTKDDATIPFFGELNYLKGGDAYVEYAEANPDQKFPVYGPNKLRRPIPANVEFRNPVDNAEVMKILGRTKRFLCKPVWPEPSGRLAAEAFLSGCEIITNDRVGTFSYDFYPSDKEKAAKEMNEAPENFWTLVEGIFAGFDKPSEKSIGRVLVYKSYGGLGDVFFCIPSLHVLRSVSESVSFAVQPRLVAFFKKHLTGIEIVDETEVIHRENEFDKVIELGNYPAFRGYDLPHAIRYPTHKRVKQHAIGHYIDAVSKFHIDIKKEDAKFPYFDRTPDLEKPYYTIHPGAGFLLKIWPTERYARVIKMIHDAFPQLKCKIIKGPEDPDPADFIDVALDYVEYVTGGMEDVGEAMSKALFHIGNDAGITHVAGAFNVPTVGIYGPTGPGSWGSFAEHSEIIWGKSGNCGLKCNYDVILNCQNRVCLSSTTPEKVMGALFRLLEKAYPDLASTTVINPDVRIEMTDVDCMLSIDKNEFVVNFINEQARENVCRIMAGDFSGISNQEMEQFAEFLHQQNILLKIPAFNVEPSLM